MSGAETTGENSVPLSHAFRLEQFDQDDVTAPAEAIFADHLRVAQSPEFRDLIEELERDPSIQTKLEGRMMRHYAVTEEAALDLVLLRNTERVRRALALNTQEPPSEIERRQAALFFGADMQTASWRDIRDAADLYLATRRMLYKAVYPADGYRLTLREAIAAEAERRRREP